MMTQQEVMSSRGYLVFCQLAEETPYRPGDVPKLRTDFAGRRMQQPFVVAVETDETDWLEQCRLMDLPGKDNEEWRYYRCTTD
jgi:hypothetical protein